MNNIRQFNFREPQATDRKPSFQTYHDLVMAVARTLGMDISRDPTIQPILLMELDEDLPPYDESADPDQTTGNMPYIDRKGTVLYFDPQTQTWERDDSQQKETLCNFTQGYYPVGGRYLFRYLQQGAKFVPCDNPPPTGYAKMTEMLDCRLAGRSALAKVLEWNRLTPTHGEWLDSDTMIRVYAPPANSLGVILKNMKVQIARHEGPGWVVVGGGMARKIVVSARFAFAKTADTFFADVVDWDDGEDPDPDNAGITVYNRHEFYGATGSEWTCLYMPTDNRYVALQGICDT